MRLKHLICHQFAFRAIAPVSNLDKCDCNACLLQRIPIQFCLIGRHIHSKFRQPAAISGMVCHDRVVAVLHVEIICLEIVARHFLYNLIKFTIRNIANQHITGFRKLPKVRVDHLRFCARLQCPCIPLSRHRNRLIFLVFSDIDTYDYTDQDKHECNGANQYHMWPVYLIISFFLLFHTHW